MEKENLCGDLIIKASITRKPPFKAGSELSGRVNLKQVDVEINDTSTEDSQNFDIAMRFRACANVKVEESANS